MSYRQTELTNVAASNFISRRHIVSNKVYFDCVMIPYWPTGVTDGTSNRKRFLSALCLCSVVQAQALR